MKTKEHQVTEIHSSPVPPWRKWGPYVSERAWGNHDVLWMGACLGHEVLIATVVRISLRYRRLSQFEEGYGLIMSPLEKLARTMYAGDPAERFNTRGYWASR